MSDQNSKPRIVINSQGKPIKLCCGNTCVQIPSGSFSPSIPNPNSGSTDPGASPTQPATTQTGPGIPPMPVRGSGRSVKFFIERFYVKDIEGLLQQTHVLLNEWKPLVKDESVVDGFIEFEIENVDEIPLDRLGPLNDLSIKVRQPVVLWC